MIKLSTGNNKIFINNDSLVSFESGTSYALSFVDESSNQVREIDLKYSTITDRYVEFLIGVTLDPSETGLTTIFLPTGTHFLTISNDEETIYKDFVFVEGLIDNIKTIPTENTSYTIK